MLIWLKKQNHIKHKSLLSRMKMGKEIITFGDIRIRKHKFHLLKSYFFRKCRH